MYGRFVPRKNFLDATPTFGHVSTLVGVVKRKLAIARARTIIIDGRLRLETKGPAMQC